MALVTIRRSPSVQTPKNTEDETEKSTESIDENDGTRSTKSLNECYFANKGAAVVLGCSERPFPGRRRSPPRSLPQPDIQHHLQSMFYLLRPEETLKMAVKLESVHPGRTRYLVVVCSGEEAALLGIDCNTSTTVGLVLRVLVDTSIKLDGDGGFSVCVASQQHIFKPVSVQAMWSALQTLHRASARARQYNHFAGGNSHTWVAYYEERVDSDRSCLNEWHAMDNLESRRPPSPDSLRNKPRKRDETEQIIRCTLKEIMMSVDLDEVTSKVIRGRLEDELNMDLAEYKSFIDEEMLTILGQMDAPTEIFDHVYLGSEWNASNLEELRRNGVRHILNVTREIDNFFPGVFDYLNIRVYDDEKTDLLKHWDNTYKYIHKAEKEGSKVLVHCKMGISRSASVVIAYAMKAYNWNFDKALKHVKQKRSCIKPNNNFLGQLETYQGILDAMKNKEKLQRSKSETNLKSPKIASKIESKILDPTPLIQALTGSCGGRPRSWSPDSRLAADLLPPTSLSLEQLTAETRHMMCAGASYSVSPNQIIRLREGPAPSVRLLVHEIEGRRLHFAQPDTESSRHYNKQNDKENDTNKIHSWDPGETNIPKSEVIHNNNDINDIVKCDSGIVDLKLRAIDNYATISDEKRTNEEDVMPPSRQSSWSSFDSAVVPDLSRHSSWSSYDTRSARPHVAIREDSSFHKKNIEKTQDSKKEEVQSDDRVDVESRSSQQKVCTDLGIISECVEGRSCKMRGVGKGEKKSNDSCAISKESECSRRAATWCGRVCSAGWARGALRRPASHGDLPRRSAPPAPAAGLVRSRRREFEALTNAARLRPDLSVRLLVDKYDANKCDSVCDNVGNKLPQELLSKKCRYNSEGDARPRAPSRGASERPPVAPVVVMPSVAYHDVLVSTVMSKAQTKKQLQHGKTHPLTRLNLNRSNNRCSNAVYNTM